MARVARGEEIHALEQGLTRGRVHSAYLVYGDEEFLISECIRLLKRHFLAGIPVDFNFDQYDARDHDAQKVIDTANTLPMMAPRRLVILRNVFDYKPAGLNIIADYLRRPSTTTALVMTGGALQRGGGRASRGQAKQASSSKPASSQGKPLSEASNVTPSQIVTLARKAGEVIELRTLYERQVRNWIQGEMARNKKRMDGRSVTYLLDMVGENLRELHSELFKLCTYVGERPNITLSDVQEVVSDVSADAIFEFVNAVGGRNASVALLHSSKMLESDPSGASGRVLGMLHRHFAKLYRARELFDSSSPPAEIARASGVRDNMIWKWEKETLPQVKRRSRRNLLNGLKVMYECQLAMRTSRAPQALQLEGLVLRLCR